MTVEMELAQYFTKDLGFSDFEMTYMQGGAYILSKVRRLTHTVHSHSTHFQLLTSGALQQTDFGSPASCPAMCVPVP